MCRSRSLPNMSNIDLLAHDRGNASRRRESMTQQNPDRSRIALKHLALDQSSSYGVATISRLLKNKGYMHESLKAMQILALL